MAGYRYRRFTGAITMIGTDPTGTGQLVIVGAGTPNVQHYLRIFRWSLRGAFVHTGNDVVPCIAICDALVVPHPRGYVLDADYYPRQAAGIVSAFNTERDWGDVGRLFKLPVFTETQPCIGIFDLFGTATAISAILEIDYGYDLNPQTFADAKPGPL